MVLAAGGAAFQVSAEPGDGCVGVAAGELEFDVAVEVRETLLARISGLAETLPLPAKQKPSPATISSGPANAWVEAEVRGVSLGALPIEQKRSRGAQHSPLLLSERAKLSQRAGPVATDANDRRRPSVRTLGGQSRSAGARPRDALTGSDAAWRAPSARP